MDTHQLVDGSAREHERVSKGKKYSPDDFNPYVTKAQENEGIDTKSDVLELMERVKNL